MSPFLSIIIIKNFYTQITKKFTFNYIFNPEIRSVTNLGKSVHSCRNIYFRKHVRQSICWSNCTKATLSVCVAWRLLREADQQHVGRGWSFPRRWEIAQWLRRHKEMTQWMTRNHKAEPAVFWGQTLTDENITSVLGWWRREVTKRLIPKISHRWLARNLLWF